MADVEPFLLAAPVAVYLLGALLALYVGRAAYVAALAGSLLGLGLALEALLGGTVQSLHLLTVAPFADLALRLDPLAAYFLLVITVLGAAVSLYALGYLDAAHSSPGVAAVYNGFLAAMVLVVLADTVFAFLCAWEAMSLLSYLLVVHEHQHAEVRRAGYLYLVMTHVGTAFLVPAFLALFVVTGSLDFGSFRAAAPTLPSLTRNLVFLLALVGFSTKAGVIPLHIWLPQAHPAAPSHVSALMSGVMIKTAVYGLLRLGWAFAGPGPAWWGAVVLTLGIVSAVLGVLYALMEHDLKRLLAYHSVENIGIILIGIGTAFLLSARGAAVLAALALAAGLYHVLNHAVFKGLLFLGAGAVQKATHTRDFERLGGLIHRMPWTAGTFLIGAAAISALPPLNGFVSEWLTFQALLQLAATASGPVGATGAAAAAGLLALTGGLAALCFVKAFGVAFLGVPRSEAAAGAHEVNRPMRGGMVLLATLCCVLGLAPTVVLRLLAPVTQSLLGGSAMPPSGLLLVPPARGGSLAPLGLLALVTALGVMGMVLARLLGRGPGRTRIAPPWVCGGLLTPMMQYSAAALSQPISLIFRGLIRPDRQVTRSYTLVPYFVTALRHEVHVQPVYKWYLYGPVVRGLLWMSQQVRGFQSGGLRLYLAYMLATLVAVLFLTR
jgi:hydrogenase-4 component B